MDDATLQSITRDLPNFPEQVIRLWLEHGSSEGWPPRHDRFGEPEGKWRTVLAYQGVPFWRGVTWSLEPVPLTPQSLTVEGAIMVANLRNAFVAGLAGAPGVTIPDSSQRIAKFVNTLQQTGRLPVPPVGLLLQSGELDLMDGFHRVAALLHARLSGVGIPAHEAWIGRHAGPTPES